MNETRTTTEHTTDTDCHIGPDGACSECGVVRGDACNECGGQSFHVNGCTGFIEDWLTEIDTRP